LGITLAGVSIGWTISHNSISTVLTDFPEDERPMLASLNSSLRFVSGGIGFWVSSFIVQKSFSLNFLVIGVLILIISFSLQSLVVTGIKELKKIDILVNNAGVSSQYPFEKQPMEDLEKLAHTNYLGYVRLIRLVIPYMLEQKSGAIINMVSGSTLCDPLPR